MKKRKKKNGKNKIDILTLVMSIVFALVWGVAGEFLYQLLHGVIWTPLVIGLYFLGLGLTQFLSIQLCGLIRGRAAEGRFVKKALCMILAVVVAAMAMDWVYEVVSFQEKWATSLIFLIDDSVSMNEQWTSSSSSGWLEPNDPDMKRVDAIKEVMNGCDEDMLFAVYDFKQECEQQIPLTPASQVNTINFDFFGGTGQTYVFNGLNCILDDIASGKLEGAGEKPRIILLTDGGSSDKDFEGVQRKAAELNVSICTVGFGDDNEIMLSRIAEENNGVYVHGDSAVNLVDVMTQAANAVTEEEHNLLNYRETLNNDWIFFLIRMVLVLVLGVMFLYIKAQLLRTNMMELNVLPIHIVLLLLGGLCLEVGINILGLDEFCMRMLMCILILINVTGHDRKAQKAAIDDSNAKIGAYDFDAQDSF